MTKGEESKKSAVKEYENCKGIVQSKRNSWKGQESVRQKRGGGDGRASCKKVTGSKILKVNPPPPHPKLMAPKPRRPIALASPPHPHRAFLNNSVQVCLHQKSKEMTGPPSHKATHSLFCSAALTSIYVFQPKHFFPSVFFLLHSALKIHSIISQFLFQYILACGAECGNAPDQPGGGRSGCPQRSPAGDGGGGGGADNEPRRQDPHPHPRPGAPQWAAPRPPRPPGPMPLRRVPPLASCSFPLPIMRAPPTFARPTPLLTHIFPGFPQGG